MAPDALSRTVATLMHPQPPADDVNTLAACQEEDEELARFRETEHSLQLRHKRLLSGRTLVIDESTATPRPWIPAPLRRAYFKSVHDLAHPGVRATVDLVTRRFVWPSVKKDAANWARACVPCQRNKIHRHTTAAPAQFPPPADRFRQVHIDLVGPLPTSDGYRYLLTAVDRFSRWPEAVPLRGITAPEGARALISGWISRFGVPAEIITDRGSQFESALWAELSAVLGWLLAQPETPPPAPPPAAPASILRTRAGRIPREPDRLQVGSMAAQNNDSGVAKRVRFPLWNMIVKMHYPVVACSTRPFP